MSDSNANARVWDFEEAPLLRSSFLSIVGRFLIHDEVAEYGKKFPARFRESWKNKIAIYQRGPSFKSPTLCPSPSFVMANLFELINSNKVADCSKPEQKGALHPSARDSRREKLARDNNRLAGRD